MSVDPAIPPEDSPPAGEGERGTYHGGTATQRRPLYRAVELLIPSIVKAQVKSARRAALRLWNRARRLEAARFVELGRGFRFDCTPPHVARIGERSIAEDHNVWNTAYGDIEVGRNCWFGLHNVVMGPLKIGDRLSTGPYVLILGPRHPTFERRIEHPRCTVIGDDVWISAGAIVLSGSVIGDGAVIGAGAIVSGRVPPNSTYLERRGGRLLPRFG